MPGRSRLPVGPGLLRVSVIEDVLLRYHHVNPERENEKHDGRVPVFRRLPGGGKKQHESGDRHKGEAHEPLFCHIH